MLQNNYDNVPAELKNLLFFQHVEAGKISEEVFAAHVEEANSNANYKGFLELLAADEKSAAMYQMMVAAGPTQILSLVSLMVDQGVVSKADVRGAAKIKSTTTKSISWQNSIRNDMLPAVYEAAQNWWSDNREAIAAKHPEVEGCQTLQDFLAATGKASLGTTVDKMVNAESGQECSLAISFRIDANCASRNGTQPKAETDATTESNNGA